MNVWINNRMRGLITVVIGLVVFSACGNKKSNTTENKEKDKLENLFFAYDFTLDGKTTKERVVFLDSLGYQGVTFAVNNVNDLKKIHEYRQYIMSETNNRLKIPAVFYHHNMANENASKVWKQIADRLAGSETDIWVIIGTGKKKNVEKDEVVQFFKDISDYAKPLHLNIVIYPHDKTYIESAAESLPYLQAADRDNLFLSFHLCHELRAGNGARMDEAIAEVAQFIKLASISGSDTQMQPDSLKGWDDAIKPLYKGDYDAGLFMESLVRHGYSGPVALHTYGLKEPVQEHFKKSKEVWDKMCHDIVLRAKEE